MPSVPLHPLPHATSGLSSPTVNPLPQLLQTPSGLAILELQGTINMPTVDPSDLPDAQGDGHSQQTSIGRLVFPDYSTSDPKESAGWMKKVYLYVGRHQRLTGEVKKLPNPLAVVRRRVPSGLDEGLSDGIAATAVSDEELEILEVVYHKIIFSSRPEPVSV
ncbi:MAG: hypothetical protein FRX48_01259 [Lasallia pustulata]|uniref:Sister chromatid cohesion protein Ctf8 n=1 Tax=Lasallia pustulata TaxID=136370 RepID=A0A5M8PZS0_9LECA|nr:MAG: hypothetical protein FRX48_01259 [Lasallia pustulata]